MEIQQDDSSAEGELIMAAAAAEAETDEGQSEAPAFTEVTQASPHLPLRFILDPRRHPSIHSSLSFLPLSLPLSVRCLDVRSPLPASREAMPCVPLNALPLTRFPFLSTVLVRCTLSSPYHLARSPPQPHTPASPPHKSIEKLRHYVQSVQV